MSTMSDLDLQMQAVTRAIEETPEHRLGMAMHQAFEALDEIMALAADPNTSHLVAGDLIAVGQLVSRTQLIASFVLARKRNPNG